MPGSTSIIMTVRMGPPGDLSDRSDWAELVDLVVDKSGGWVINAECGCFITSQSWLRCADHGLIDRLYLQTVLPFAIAES